MIYTYIALGIISLYSIISTGAYLEEKKAHKKTFHQARKIISEDREIMDAMHNENTRLSLIARAYKTLAIVEREK